MQRLLRGWLLYLALGVLTLALYWLAHPGAHEATLPASVSTQAAAAATEWWPQEIDAATLRRIADQRPGLMISLSLLSVLMLGLGAVGLLVTMGALWSGRLRRLWRVRLRRLPRWSFGELARILVLVVVMAALMPFVRMAALSVFSALPGDAHFWVTLSMLWLDIFMILTVLAFALPKGPSVWKTLAGPTTRWREAGGIGLRSYVLVFPWIFLLLYVVVAVAHKLGYQPPMEPIQELIFQEERGFVLGLTALLACVVGPVAEELFFRGVLHNTLRTRLPRGLAIAGSAVCFALVHTNVVGFAPIWVLGMLLAYAYERTGSLIAPIAIHVAHNTLLMTFGFVMRELLQLAGT
jgi:membrane protease YdiL (CAAX protease family)